jgi:hypothetical protein
MDAVPGANRLPRRLVNRAAGASTGYSDDRKIVVAGCFVLDQSGDAKQHTIDRRWLQEGAGRIQ